MRFHASLVGDIAARRATRRAPSIRTSPPRRTCSSPSTSVARSAARPRWSACWRTTWRGLRRRSGAAQRPVPREDGWLATCFESGPRRAPPGAARSASRRSTRAHAPIVAALERYGAEPGEDLRRRVVAVYAMQLGLSLKRLTQPELVDDQLGVRMGRIFLEEVDGVSGIRLATAWRGAPVAPRGVRRRRGAAPRRGSSRFYRERLDPAAPLPAQPTLDKATMMEHYDDVVTDPRLRRDALLAHVEQAQGDERYLGRYRPSVAALPPPNSRPGACGSTRS